ncbi:MAG: urocanate hydratase, partial [Thermoplasmata archaeon]|nr:urocanate hydratase [Thermoplasmata archaeon]
MWNIDKLPDNQKFDPEVDRAPGRGFHLSKQETILAIRNALRYIPLKFHKEIIDEFLHELVNKGRVYGYRFRPHTMIKAGSIEDYEGNTLEGKAIQYMINNNLDHDIALFPYELVTYGSTGQVCQNWMQYRLIIEYLKNIRPDQTLVVASGHPLGLFPSSVDAPRVIMTNGLLIGEFDNQESFNKGAALGVTNYGQMTAGGWMYIGPQGIVHGTYITLLNAGRNYLNIPDDGDIKGKLFITSGLGGMSGAQAKAVEIAGGIGVIAETNTKQILKRHQQGWVSRFSNDLEEIFKWVEKHRISGDPISIAYNGNIVDLWEYVVDNKILVELGSD